MKAVNSLIELFVRRVGADGDQPAILLFRDGNFQPTLWRQLADDVGRLAASLKDLGVTAGDRVALVSENRYEWIVTDLAIQATLAVHVPLHATLSGTQIIEQMIDSGARISIFSTIQQINKLTDLATKQFPVIPSDSMQFISFEPCDQTLFGKSILDYSSLIENASSVTGQETLQQAAADLTLQNLATIIYTSGTTGQPKGVMLSQGNLVSNTLAVIEAFEMKPTDRRLNFLPFSHIFARTCDLYTWIARSSSLALARSRELILDDCKIIQPTVLNGVPYFFDKVARAAAKLQTENKQEISTNFLKEIFGGKIEFCCSGGAALPDHTARYFFEHDVPLLQGYGLTETSPVISISTKRMHKLGTAGKAIVDVEIKIADDGEIASRGPHIMQGYWQQPEETKKVLREGWFYTGDLGEVDEDGFLRITGRKKEILVTSSGKNVAPVYLESLLTADPLIAQAVVIGNGRKYLTALIVPDADSLKSEIIARKIAVTSRQQALVHPAVIEMYEQCISERLSTVAEFEQVRRFTILSRGFTIESQELTPTLKIRRSVIEINCQAEIEAMYSVKN